MRMDAPPVWWAAALVLVLAGPARAIDEFSLDSDDVVAGKLGQDHYAAPAQGLGCRGGNVSPHLSWFGAPPGTDGFALTMRDLDAAPGTAGIHWIVINIPASVSEIPRGAGNDASKLPAGTVVTRNDFGARDYVGMCPPAGKPHNYIFRLTALSVGRIDVRPTMSAAEIEGRIRAASLGSAAFVVKQAR